MSKKLFRIALATAAASSIVILAPIAVALGATAAPIRGKTVQATLSDDLHIPPSEMIPVSQIHRGMEGYGLTVFQGTTISKFKVQVIDILRKQYMGRDLILIRMSGGPITERNANIIAGMSGSPVYFNGKLAGAISMGYEWPKEPVAMVTPIEYMQEAFNPRLPTHPQFSATPWSPQPAEFAAAGFGDTPVLSQNGQALAGQGFARALESMGFGMAGLGAPTGESETSLTDPVDAAIPHPLLTPIYTNGLSPLVTSRLARALAPYGLRVASGMGGGQAPSSASLASLEPGSMIGVHFCTGDVDLGGYGTVTYRKGNHILAFGHPMEELGPVDFPISTCYVVDIFTSFPRSEKMCLPGKIVGSLKQDRPWSVMGAIGAPAHTVPLTISVDDRQTGASRTFHIQCINHPLFTSMVADVACQEAITEVRSYPADSMVEADVEVDPSGLPPIIRTNTYFDYFNPEGMGVPCLAEMDRILDMLQSNPFQAVSVDGIKVSLHIRPGREMSSIERISVNKSQVAPGDKVHVDVTLRPWKGLPCVVPLDVQIPADAPNGAATLMVTGGMLSPTPLAPSAGGGIQIILGGGGTRAVGDPAANLEDMIDRFLKQEKNTDLVGRVVQSASPSLNIGGERLYNLPPAISAALRSPRATGAFPLPDEAKTVLHLTRMIIGAQGVPITIQREDNSGAAGLNAGAGAPDTSAPHVVIPPASGASLASDTQAATISDTDTNRQSPSLVASEATAQITGSPGDDTRPGANDMIVPPAGGAAPATPPGGKKPATPTPDSAASGAPAGAAADSPPETVARKLQTWTLHSQSDFDDGRSDGIGVGSLGDLSLTPRFTRLQNLDKDDYIWVARSDRQHGMLIGTGNQGVVYRVDMGHNLSVALKTPDPDVLSLAVAADGTTYAGTAPHGAIYRIPRVGAAPTTPFFKTGKHYVLALAVDAAGNVYAGTDGGTIYRVTPDGKGSIWYQSTESHICALDIAANGDVLAGTSPSGLVYRITAAGKASVLWDTGDTSVSALTSMPNGDTLVGTAPKGEILRIPLGGADATTVVKTDLPVHDICRVNDEVYVAAGPALYEVLPSNEVRKITNGDDQDILAIGMSPTGDMLAGTGNVATLYLVHSIAKTSWYRSPVKDAGEISTWSFVRWSGDQPAGSDVTIESRSGNNNLPDSSWSAWSPATDGPGGAAINSPAARFLQLRVRMAPGQAESSPTIRTISVTYLPQNRPPTISITSPAPGSASHGKTDLQWTAQDPDGDALVYKVTYSGDRGLTWLPAVVLEKDGKAPTGDLISDSYQWDTTGLKDGTYLLKVVVSDRRSNPTNALDATALTGPFLIANTEPKLVLKDTSVHVMPDNSVTFEGAADGEASIVASVTFRVDEGVWYSAASKTGFFDTAKVEFQGHTAPVGTGPHKLEVQVVTAAGTKTTSSLPIKNAVQAVALIK